MVTQDIRVNHSIIPVIVKQPGDEDNFPPSSSSRRRLSPIVQSSAFSVIASSSPGASMTVEQSSAGTEELQQGHTGTRCESRDSVLRQLKEVTGVEDAHLLQQALEASRNESGSYDLTQAVNILVDGNAVCYNQVGPKAVGVASSSAIKEKDDVKVIDLTSETSEKDELQKAIALSLQEQQHGMLGGQVTAEEQDISLVLERSLLTESMVGAKRKRGEIWQDPLNPHERKRKDCCPVGLKNVGNTCWFSAVIQSLFHLPVFRRLVLNFIPCEDWDIEALSANSMEKRNLLFMQELRCLFALMVGTRRKYVDPSKAVEILKEAFQSGSNDSQQDVSEFTHKLLEWLEDAFKSDSPRSLSLVAIDNVDGPRAVSSKHNNPMLDLFYGQFRSEGLNNGHVFSNEETFGQYPLQVNGFRNIHESLEAATAQEIETNSSEAMTKSGQEHWFTCLPPVLLFELSRFQFNQHIGRPEKIHNKFEFPEVVYMDRYMETNKDITKTKRESIQKLIAERNELQTRLEKFLNFGSGSKRFPLQEVLQYTLEFVENKRDTNSPLPPPDVEMTSPCSSLSMAGDSPSRSQSTSDTIGFRSIVLSSSRDLETNEKDDCKRGSDINATPFPKHVSETELRVLQNCLRRWRTEVEKDVKELQDLIRNIDKMISNMYNETALQKVPYRLHAVLVHEGQAASGHYWAYVYDHFGKRWLKFNDITVTESTWDELEKESAGGYHNASAYCLMYIDGTRNELVGHCADDESGGQFVNSMDSLLPDLYNLVFEDNLCFQKEIDAWDHNRDTHNEQVKESSPDETLLGRCFRAVITKAT